MTTTQPAWSPPSWTAYVLDLGRPATPAPCPECGATPEEYDDCQNHTGWFAPRDGARLCDDCVAELIPSPIVEALEHLNSLDTVMWHAANPAGGLLWDGPTRDPDPGDRVAAQIMVVQLVGHYLGKFQQWYLAAPPAEHGP